MTDMYNDPPKFEGKLTPYPHAERPEVSDSVVPTMGNDDVVGVLVLTHRRGVRLVVSHSAAVPMIP